MSLASRIVARRRFLILAAVVAGLGLAGTIADAWAQFGTPGTAHSPPRSGMLGWVFAQQALFYRALASAIRAAKTSGSASWGLMGISFAYGVFHAAGPGHGKAVISSYLFANEETWRRGVALSFASAVLQSLTAIAIVAIAALLIGATAKMMGDTVRVIETVSYGLVIVVGARLLWIKGKGFLATLHGIRVAREPAQPGTIGGGADRAPSCACGHETGHGPGHDRHRHADGEHRHHHADGEEASLLPWGHAHGPEPKELVGPDGWRRGLSAIVAVGLRPCSGAIIVLVFALAQGLFWAGVASTFVMGLGTALTVGSIATLAVGAKSLAKRLSLTRPGYGTLVLRGIEVGAAALVIVVGVALLSGYMETERMGFF